MSNDVKPLRVGAIDFLNCFPITWGLEQTGGLADCVVTPATPDRLSDLLVAGDLDVGPISLVEALRHADDLVLLDAPAVVADGPAGSVLLVTTRPLEALDGATIALGSTSRTSVELARMLLEDRVGVRPTYVSMAPDVDAMLARADAAVLIGDPALRLALSGAPDGVELIDLAQEWRAWTGLPMVFAVWAARREAVRVTQAELAALEERYAAALVAARSAPASVAHAAAERSGLGAGALERYFAGLSWVLDDRAREGLEAFSQRLTIARRQPMAPSTSEAIEQ